jgi:tetratricopeptide (TPR) repeat protein
MHKDLGNILFCQGKYECAVSNYQQALALNPDFAEAYNNLGAALTALERYEEAISNCRRAIQLRPDSPRAYNNLGNAHKGLGQLGEAVAAYQEALRFDPDLAEAHSNLGIALSSLDRLDEAIAHHRAALRCNPVYAPAYYNLGLVYTSRSHWEDAVAALQRAAQLQPDHAGVHFYLGWALGEQGKAKEAGLCYERTIQLNPDYADAHWALAHNRLLRGDLERGWTGYEWRWRLKVPVPHSVEEYLWDGSPLTGKTILLHTEQGLGDTLQFIRYAAVVKPQGGTVIVSCQKTMPLLASCPGVDQLVAAGSEPPFDVQAPLLSLPRILKTSLATVPAHVPYLFADVRHQGKWQSKLSRYRGFKIGIAWQGNPSFARDVTRSIPLIHFAPLARIEGVRLISLQQGPGTEQLEADPFPIIDLGTRLDKKSGAFMDTAAVMKNLHLVISCDTAIAHLAGALGVPVWLALPYVPDWRWLLEREDSPWYPSMRLFRQTEAVDWNGVFERMALRLSERLGAGTSPRPLTVEIAPGELIDKITILEIKLQKISDPVKQRNVHAECEALKSVRDRDLGQSEEIAVLTFELQAVNQRLWHVEDEIRLCEQAKDFGPRFIELARSVYQENDRRAALKRRINELLGSRIAEEKCYTSCK